MFTGIVEELGVVREVALSDGGGTLALGTSLATECVSGDSLAVNGCCLTVVSVGAGWVRADVVAETVSRTTLGSLRAGEMVNLELPVRPDGRLGGHIVQGHVDGVGHVLRGAPELVVRVPDGLVRFVVEKGSVALDGVSLTVAGIEGDDVHVALIPHTCSVTTLGRKVPGDLLNVEVDVVAKYVERMLVPFRAAQA